MERSITGSMKNKKIAYESIGPITECLCLKKYPDHLLKCPKCGRMNLDRAESYFKKGFTIKEKGILRN